MTDSYSSIDLQNKVFESFQQQRMNFFEMASYSNLLSTTFKRDLLEIGILFDCRLTYVHSESSSNKFKDEVQGAFRKLIDSKVHTSYKKMNISSKLNQLRSGDRAYYLDIVEGFATNLTGYISDVLFHNISKKLENIRPLDFSQPHNYEMNHIFFASDIIYGIVSEIFDMTNFYVRRVESSNQQPYYIFKLKDYHPVTNISISKISEIDKIILRLLSFVDIIFHGGFITKNYLRMLPNDNVDKILANQRFYYEYIPHSRFNADDYMSVYNEVKTIKPLSDISFLESTFLTSLYNFNQISPYFGIYAEVIEHIYGYILHPNLKKKLINDYPEKVLFLTDYMDSI